MVLVRVLKHHQNLIHQKNEYYNLCCVREECVAPFQWHQERKNKTNENDNNKEEKVL